MDERLYRSRSDRMLTGVAGGLAERLDVDPSLVRVAWAVSMPLTGFVTLLIYIVMAIVVPEDPYPPSASAFAGPGPGGPKESASASNGPTEGTTTAAPAEGGAGAAAAGTAPAPAGPLGWTGTPLDRSTARTQRRAARAEWRAQHPGGGGAVVLGVILVGLGILFLAQQVVPDFDWDVAWPIAAIVLGLILVIGSYRRS